VDVNARVGCHVLSQPQSFDNTSDAGSIYPIEMVYGVIEVKTTLQNHTADCFEKCTKLRQMSRLSNGKDNKYYVISDENGERAIHSNRLSPRFFVFSYNAGWKKSESIKNNFIEMSAKYPDAFIHGTCVLNKDILVKHILKEENVEIKVGSNGFKRFLTNLGPYLDGMLPPNRMGLGFPPNDISRYLKE
jgi:hypothetical protein